MLSVSKKTRNLSDKTIEISVESIPMMSLWVWLEKENTKKKKRGFMMILIW